MARRATILAAATAIAAASLLTVIPLTEAVPVGFDCPRGPADSWLLPPGLAKKCADVALPPPSTTTTVAPTTTTVPMPSPTTTSAPTTTTAPSSTSAPATTTTGSARTGAHPLDLPRVPWEGGPSYYAQFSGTAPWASARHFPIGVWFESVLSQNDVDLDKAAGLNTYVELTTNSSLSLVRDNGLYAIPHGVRSGHGSETAAWLVDDEADMGYGPGWAAWNGGGWGSCSSPCGYTVMKTKSQQHPSDGRPRYANFGKGVMFWESDAEAEVFVNDFTKLTSADIYWYTDTNVCGGSEGPTRIEGSGPVNAYTGLRDLTTTECRRAWNYGLTMDRLRHLDGMDGQRQPIYAFVEVGHPSSENGSPTITGPQIKGAVMASLIHEARGILYFNHSFGGACQSQHLLRDSCGAANRPAVVEVNRQIAELAPVLNTQSYAHTFNPALDTMLKYHAGSYYLFAMQEQPSGGSSQQFTLPDGLTAGTVEVLYEDRSIAVQDGKFTDSFAAEHSYHIYKITP